jgi:hypothetical protein
MSAKRIGVATLLVLATLFWTAACFGVWAQRQALQTDNWVDTSSRMLEDPQIRNALAVALVDRLYDTRAVEERLRETLPPRLDRLAAPAAAGLKEVALGRSPTARRTGSSWTSSKAASRRTGR